jgi:hypothetical protein
MSNLQRLTLFAVLCAAAACSDDSAGPDNGAAAGSGQAGSSNAAGSAAVGAGSSAAGSGGAGSKANAAGGTGGAGSSANATAGTSGTPSSAAGAPAPAAGSGGAPAAGSGAPANKLQAQIVAKNIPPEGQEHVCVVVDLGNAASVWVSEVSATLSGGSHHLIVDRQPADTTVYTDPKKCTPTMGGDTSRLIIAQQKQTSVVLPSGVAFKLEAHQKLFLQLHYFNVDATAHDITGTVQFTLLNASEKPPIEAKNLFTGSTQINIPAHSQSESKAFYKPMAAKGTRKVFALTSHTHRLGVMQTIERVDSMNAPTTTPLHTSTMWSEPPLTQLNPVLSFNGTDGLRLICRYSNDTDETVTFGVEAQNEMCFMWLYYYDE